LSEKYYLLESKDDQSRERIGELETKIVALERVEVEKDNLEKMLKEQQNIIRLALARILPRKGEVSICEVGRKRKLGISFTINFLSGARGDYKEI
jgi:hypothetical protein